MKCIFKYKFGFRHDYGKWGQVVNTGNHIYKAQFSSCNNCNRIRVRFISLWTSSSCAVDAKTINEHS